MLLRNFTGDNTNGLVRVLHVKGRNAKGRPGQEHLWFLQLIDFPKSILKPSA
jgi:hypothetical protein